MRLAGKFSGALPLLQDGDFTPKLAKHLKKFHFRDSIDIVSGECSEISSQCGSRSRDGAQTRSPTTSSLKELDSIPQFRATATLGQFFDSLGS
jgi:hypothetical protein